MKLFLETGYQINDDNITEYVIDGLGSEFRSFLSFLNSRDSMTFEQLCDWLIKEDAMQRRLDKKDKDSSDFLANYAN